MKVRFLLDENLPPRLKMALLRREPAMDVLRVSDPEAPPLGTPDPEILLFLERSQRLLITSNRVSMWKHLRAHWAAGRHLWGLFWLRRGATNRQIIDDVLLIWNASEAEEWFDRVGDLPL
jgi:hypothetical protein